MVTLNLNLCYIFSMIDLHSHTTASDGTLQPCELIQHAVEKKLSVIAVTDHDTTAGLQEASAEAKKLGITFVPSLSWDNFGGENIVLREVDDIHISRIIFLRTKTSKYLTKEQKECIQGIKEYFNTKYPF